MSDMPPNEPSPPPNQPFPSSPPPPPPWNEQPAPSPTKWAPNVGQPTIAGARTNGNAIAALCCAIGAWLVCPLIPAIVALFLAASADREIVQSMGEQTGEGLAKAARIVSWVHIGLFGFAAAVIMVAAVASS